MKVSYKNFPIIEKIEKKDIGEIVLFQCDRNSVNLMLGLIRSKFREVALGINNSHIYHLSSSFIEAYESAGDKLFQSNLYSEIEDENLCFLSKSLSTMLKIRNDRLVKLITVSFAHFTNDEILLGAGDMFINYENGIPSREIYGFASANDTNVINHIFNCVLITLFIKYADVETKSLAPGQKPKGIVCNYNSTKSKVVLLNSTWFTNLVKSDGFKVRGHFRLQPKKVNGEWTKELIWVNDFMKSGYTAPARILSQDKIHKATSRTDQGEDSTGKER